MWSADKYNSGPFDRFSLLIPYCLDYIRWDVIFDAESPNAAPDVIFGPEDDHFHPFHMLPSPESNNNCLSDWNYKDPSRLLTLIQFLRDQYVLYQRKRVEEVDDERLKFEISTILSREGIEMYTGSNADKLEEVKFAVPLLDMNINKMVSCCPWRYSQKIYLQVVYPVGRKYTSVPSAPRLKLVSSPELKALFSIDDVKLPSWVDGMKATFLCTSGVFTFLVHFMIPTQFPKQQPAVMLQSSQHFNSQMAPLKSRLISDYPWSPRWEPLQMAERICEFLADEALNFKRQCSEGQVQ
ncbi:BRCA1-A complex subunit BRE [Vigna unguiculata]|uniref:BRISC and BRCA1-A complex member 2 n=1 Tax=Vigna unguiculata TaxID=3917 RepID=A0A4D6M371_VIGUN|nr:BRCA1-A complex subunit BRE [Vigna unguiculata]